MTRLMKYKWALLILTLHAIATIYFAFTLPQDARVPMHWNVHNQIDGWANRTVGLLFGIGLNIALFLLLYLLHWYSPWYEKNKDRFESVLPSITTVMIFFCSLLTIFSLSLARWQTLQQTKFNLILVLIGFMFIFLGNLLPKVPKNFFVGIRTPWTIASDTVWEKTHRVGGFLFVISGVGLIKKGLFFTQNSLFQNALTVLIFAMLLYPVLHSFILYKRLGKE